MIYNSSFRKEDIFDGFLFKGQKKRESNLNPPFEKGGLGGI
jgi:hypothetical protein